MRIAIVGFGKMGKAVEKEALGRGHEISHIIDLDNQHDLMKIKPSDTNVVIEFTHPGSFFETLPALLKQAVPVVSGTTGWYDRMDEVKRMVDRFGGSFMFSSNYSIGVNVLFKLNRELAKLMDRYADYDCFIAEKHHRHKADAPSGTAISLAQDVLQNLERKNKFVTDALQNRKPESNELSVGYIRAGEIIGTHKVSYTSEIDSITIEHQAFNRRGFAQGAVVAAEWLAGKQGFYNFTHLF